MKRIFSLILSALLVISICFSVSGCKKDKKQEDAPKAPLTYEEYLAMSTEEREAYYYEFENYQDFFDWYNAAVAKYKEENPGIEIDGDINIDIGDQLPDGQ